MSDDLSGSGPLVTNELIIAFDVMWEAATRLRGLYAREIQSGGVDDPAIRRMREVRARVEAVDTDDIAEQRAMTEQLRREYAEHRARRS